MSVLSPPHFLDQCHQRENDPHQVLRRKLAFRASLDRLEERALLTVLPIGSETLVNTTVPGGQGYFSSVSGEGQVNSVAADANGNYVVVWEGNGEVN